MTAAGFFSKRPVDSMDPSLSNTIEPEPTQTNLPSFPPALINELCSTIFSLSLSVSPQLSSIDPRPSPNDEQLTRNTLLALALVSKEFYYTSRPWLWRTLRICRPRGWVGIVDKISGSDQVDMFTGADGNFSTGPNQEALSRSSTSSSLTRGKQPMIRASDDQAESDRQDQEPSPSSSGFSVFSAPPLPGISDRPHLSLERRSHSIERTQIYIDAQASALKKSVSLRSTSRSYHQTSRSPLSSNSNSPERGPRSSSARRPRRPEASTSTSFSVFLPHDRVVSESSSSICSGMPESNSYSSIATTSTSATSVATEDTEPADQLTIQQTGSWRGQSPERVGRSRFKLNIASSSLRASSLDHHLAETIVEDQYYPIPVPHPTPLVPVSICYPTSPVPSISSDENPWGRPEHLDLAVDDPLAEGHHPWEAEEEEPHTEAEFQHVLNEAGLPVRLISFASFRTTGLRRSLEDGITGKYVTPDRLGLVLRGFGNLESFGASEYMDSALTLPNLISLLFRGANPLPPVLAQDPEWRHLTLFRPLVALDLTGVNSRVFETALRNFVATFLTQEVEEVDPSDLDPEHRLSLHSCKFISSHDLLLFLPSLVNLTHLDLSYTRITSLKEIEGLKLKAISLSRCTKLDGDQLLQFLLHPARAELEDLNLYGSMSFPSPLSALQLLEVLQESPAFHSKKLRYLDISSSKLTTDHLAVFPEQPSLVSLGLSHMPTLPLRDITAFLKLKAFNVEVLTLTNTSPEITRPPNVAASMVAVHALLINPLTAPPFSFSLPSPDDPPPPAPGKLRVIELTTNLLRSLSHAKGAAWRVIRSNGSRGWYCDISAGWVSDSVLPPTAFPAFPTESEAPRFQRNIKPEHPWRKWLAMLAESNGKVDSAIGFHSRKIEVLKGEGLLGREDGLYGGFAFGFDG
ncbi:Leucine-rich repeat [Phaffia rhodozyma]|uniref:Leucine-rich repeat n=1 Tax=Phaffia rhodozyma TaxID=264483 RepID=A0A0F7SR31_PHARH|nr:Leucine-rich repeat [Phaffia rhodozyma]